jgi:hypothetical protein
VKKRSQVLFLLLLSLVLPRQVDSQESDRSLLLEVILTNYDVSRTETLVYLRVFSDGSAEAHPMREVDFRNLALRKAQITSTDLVKLRKLISPSKSQGLESRYERYWGNKDFGNEWKITIGEGDGKKTLVLANFQPFLARTKKKPYPTEVEQLGCIVWELREKVTREPLENNYVGGCRELGY